MVGNSRTFRFSRQEGLMSTRYEHQETESGIGHQLDYELEDAVEHGLGEVLAPGAGEAQGGFRACPGSG